MRLRELYLVLSRAFDVRHGANPEGLVLHENIRLRERAHHPPELALLEPLPLRGLFYPVVEAADHWDDRLLVHLQTAFAEEAPAIYAAVPRRRRRHGITGS